MVPELLQTDDFVALVPSRLLRGCHDQLVVLKPPVAVPGIDIMAAWHPE
jgi:hypothetical protein